MIRLGWTVAAAAAASSSSLSRVVVARAFSSEYVHLGSLRDNPGARKKAKRVGRGPGSGLGKTSGRGTKGQKARTGRVHGKMPRFEGGQTPLQKRLPKRGFRNGKFRRPLVPINLGRVAQWVSQGRLDPDQVINMKSLRDAGLCKQVRYGVKILARGSHHVDRPLRIEATDASEQAKTAVAAQGGSITLRYYNRVGLRAHLKPHKFEVLPRAPGIPPPRLRHKYEPHGIYAEMLASAPPVTKTEEEQLRGPSHSS